MRAKWRIQTMPSLDRRLRSPVGFRRRSRIQILVVAFVCFVLFYECVLPRHHTRTNWTPESKSARCPEASIAMEVLVVVRTGATEALEKLPVHFDTTLRCVPDFVVYSDLEENIQGHHVNDVLNDVSETLKASGPEFELYEQLRTQRREGLNSTVHLGSGPSGSPENLSWKLDRFKFMPMVNKALLHRPTAKWFVFIEADTYLQWQNLLKYLAKFDSDQNYYIGKQMWIGEVLFAHGGSGFVLSAAAMRTVTNHWRPRMINYDKYTAENWAGDMVLGKVLRDAGVQLFWAFPHFQGDPVSSLDHSVTKIDRRPWCYAPITYHHMRETDIRKLWDFAEAWHRNERGVLLHRNVFKEHIAPNLATKVDGWDNFSMDTEPGVFESLKSCQAACTARDDCLQYSFVAGTCSTSKEIRYGNEAVTRCAEYSVAASKCVRWDKQTDSAVVQSGWMIERLGRYIEQMDRSCQGEEPMWVV
ncbi:hypothetical protein FB567DRAFT_301726 [Paraphoma chrysanthemicola]|uniref:N-acetylgalactosaminide beta-1,3-galactosyltransferase n=1 Tax=Paraphoma chrysanthemicola TaxID=798071 RepID=A0A8K0W0M0_9PLEO|nr:hypothetical protein FB567DRAFT_301726 [Paraphoma chrysanthemicola]